MAKLLLGSFEIWIFAIFMAAVMVLLWDDIRAEIRRYRVKKSLEARRNEEAGASQRYARINDLLLYVPERFRVSAEAFEAGSAGLGIVLFLLTVRSAGFFMSAVCAVGVACVPYVLLCLREKSSKQLISAEGGDMISILLSGYRLCDTNIGEALEYTAAQDKDIPKLSHIMSLLVIRLRESKSKEQLKAATDAFARSIGSSWAVLLAENIYIAYAEGECVTAALEEIAGQIAEADVFMEERRRLNSESRRMTWVMIPATLFITTAMAIGQLGLTPAELIRSQFSDGIATILFVASALLFIFNVSAGELLKGRFRSL